MGYRAGVARGALVVAVGLAGLALTVRVGPRVTAAPSAATAEPLHGSAPEVFKPVFPRPCWLAYDSYYNRHRVPVGQTQLIRTPTGTYSTIANVYYDGDAGDCGLNDWVTDGEAYGWLPNDAYGLEVFVSDSWHIDRDSGTTAFTSKHELSVSEYEAPSCAGNPLATLSEAVLCGSDVSGRTMDHHEPLQGPGNSPDPHCNRPRVVFASNEARVPPGGTADYSYYVSLKVSRCSSSGGSCALLKSDTGCFNVMWTD